MNGIKRDYEMDAGEGLKGVVFKIMRVSSCELVGIVLCVAITYFLSLQQQKQNSPNRDLNFFSDASYMICCILVTLNIRLYSRISIRIVNEIRKIEEWFCRGYTMWQ